MYAQMVAMAVFSFCRKDLPGIAEKMGIDAEKLPLLILALPGNIGGRAYAGYNVGSVGLMLRLMEEAAKA